MKDHTPTPLPLKRTSEYAPVAYRPDRPMVLVVDDDWAICDAVKETLEDAGFDATCVENGEVALQHLSREPAPSAILLDLFMPVMDGWTFADRLRANPGLNQIPVIVMTASGPHWGYPAARVLHKPIYGNELVAAVQKAIEAGQAGGGASASL